MTQTLKLVAIAAVSAIVVFVVLSAVKKQTVETATVKDKDGKEVTKQVIKNHWFKIAA